MEAKYFLPSRALGPLIGARYPSLKRVLDRRHSTRNRLMYLLADARSIVEDLRRRFELDKVNGVRSSLKLTRLASIGKLRSIMREKKMRRSTKYLRNILPFTVFTSGALCQQFELYESTEWCRCGKNMPRRIIHTEPCVTFFHELTI